jgi:hypothetical protein
VELYVVPLLRNGKRDHRLQLLETRPAIEGYYARVLSKRLTGTGFPATIDTTWSLTIQGERTMNETLSMHLKPRSWLIRATVIAVSLGMIHILATPLYFDQWLGYGVFFFTVAVLQVMYSMALAVGKPNRTLLWVGIAGNALVIAMWLVTRTAGIPFGPMRGEVLSIGLLDGVAQTLAAIQVLHLAVLLRQFDELGGRPLVE